MKKEFITLKETKLTNNCPECYSTDGMVLTFKQERLSSKFLIQIKGDIIDNIRCTKCESSIFPGVWTQDIERVYSYHKKTITPKSASIKFRTLFYVLIAVIILIAAIGYLYLKHPDILT